MKTSETKIYISGPISIDLGGYKQRFSEAEDYLLSIGYKKENIYNPLNTDEILKKTINCVPTYKEYIDSDLKNLMTCDEIYMLKGWEYSRGAKLEYCYADTVGLKIKFEE